MTNSLIIGHRGAMGHAPENTLKSFQKALDLDVDMVECDVHRSKDGKIVCIHNAKLDKTTNGKGYVIRKTLEQLKTFDAGEGEKIPTLIEVLDLIDKRISINIELKGKKTLYPVLKIIERYVKEKGWKHSDFLISSFLRTKLRKIDKNKRKIRVGALLAYRPFGFLKFAKKIRAYSVNINLKLINQTLVDDAHAMGFKVFVWTVNEASDIKYVKSLKVDGIFSDFPERVSQYG